MIELRLHGVQPLTVQIDGAHHILQETLEPVEAPIEKRNIVVDAKSFALAIQKFWREVVLKIVLRTRTSTMIVVLD